MSHRIVRARWALFVVVLAASILVHPWRSWAWMADFFDGGASGNATYEAMAISPEAVHDPATGQTFLVYQGHGLDPYISVYDEGRDRWAGPYQVGSNRLSGREDAHGGPALALDRDGYLHVLYGSHGGTISIAHSAYPHAAAKWVDDGVVRHANGSPIYGTYAQLDTTADGRIRLVYRDASTAGSGDWCMLESTETSGGAITWAVSPRRLLDGANAASGGPDAGVQWYASVSAGSQGRTHVAFVLRDETSSGSVTDQFVRRNLYYMQQQADGTCTDVQGRPVSTPVTRAAADASCVVSVDVPGQYTNEPVVREDPDGRPGILFLTGSHEPNCTYEWRFARWTGSAWAISTIAKTDDFFDAGTFEYASDGSIDAYLVTGGAADDQATAAEARMAARGGDIEHWRSEDGGTGWHLEGTLMRSPDASARYNDPQIVAGHTAGSDAQVLFCEWNNDVSQYISKVFLWGSEGLRQREFTPAIHRLAGDDRIQTAVQVSQAAFPGGSDGVILADAWSYPDVLCGVPLAQAQRTPILLVNPGHLDTAVAAEIERLRGSRSGAEFPVTVLGGTASVSARTAEQACTLAGGSMTRLGGADRYETSGCIAVRLRELRGAPRRVFIASGAGFADALSVSAYAARRGDPILLTPPEALSAAAESSVASAETSSVIIVGGENAISSKVETEAASLGRSCERWAGVDRYATSAVVAEHALADGMSMERFVLASGESFADAVSGGVLAARVNGVVALTASATLTPDTASLVAAHGTRVLDAYVLGGSVAVAPQVENDLALLLYDLDR